MFTEDFVCRDEDCQVVPQWCPEHRPCIGCVEPNRDPLAPIPPGYLLVCSDHGRGLLHSLFPDAHR